MITRRVFLRPTPTFLRFTSNFPGLVSPIPVRPSLFFRHLLGSLAGVPTRLTPSRLFVSGLLITSCPDRWLSRVSAQIGCVRRSQPSAGSLRFSYPLILIPDQMTTHSPGTIFFPPLRWNSPQPRPGIALGLDKR